MRLADSAKFAPETRAGTRDRRQCEFDGCRIECRRIRGTGYKLRRPNAGKKPVDLGSQRLALSGAFGGVLREDVRHVYTGADAVAAVAAGNADATVATRAQIEHGLKPGGRLIARKGAVPVIFNPGWNVGFAVKDDSHDLADELEKQMAAMLADGRVKAIFERYGVVHRDPVLS